MTDSTILNLLRDIKAENAKENANLRHELKIIRDSLRRTEDRITKAMVSRTEIGERMLFDGIASIRKDLNILLHGQPGFRRFSELPEELRAKIWKMACFNEPRIIRLCSQNFMPCDSGDVMNYFRCDGGPCPAILHASKESRKWALKYYKSRAVEFGRYVGEWDKSLQEPWSAQQPKIYINFDIDVLYPVIDKTWEKAFPDKNWAEIVIKHRTIRNFRRVAIAHIEEWEEYSNHWGPAAESLLNPCSRIKEILVVRDGRIKITADQDLYPLAEDDEIFMYQSVCDGLSNTSVAWHVQDILGVFDSAIVEDTYRLQEIAEDDPSDDESTRPKSTAQPPAMLEEVHSSTDGNGEGQDIPNTQAPRKPFPTVKFMGIRSSHPVRLPRVNLG